MSLIMSPLVSEVLLSCFIHLGEAVVPFVEEACSSFADYHLRQCQSEKVSSPLCRHPNAPSNSNRSSPDVTLYSTVGGRNSKGFSYCALEQSWQQWLAHFLIAYE